MNLSRPHRRPRRALQLRPAPVRSATPRAPARPPTSTTTAALSYGELAERVRRLAAALRALGVRREERVLLLMHDGNDWPVSFLGALYAGRRAGGGEHAADRRRLRLHAGAQPRAGGAGVRRAAAARCRRPWPGGPRGGHRDRLARPSPRARQTRSISRPSSPPSRRWPSRPPPAPTTPASGSTPRAPPAGPRARCTRTPTRTGPPSCTARRVLGLQRERRVLLRRQAVLRLRPGQRADLPAERGRHHAADGRAADARRHLQALDRRQSQRRQAHRLLRRAHRLCRHAGLAQPAGQGAGGAAPGARRPARRCRRNSASASSATSAWTSSTASARPRCCTSSCPTGPATCATAPPAGRCRATTSNCAATTAGRARRRNRRPLHPRPDGGADVLGQPREVARHLPGRLDQERRQVRAQRRRQLHLRRAQRRHAQGQRHLRLAVRGGGHAGAAPGGAGGRRHRRARRGRADQDQGLRRAQGRPARPRRPN